jgi:hypothetical protein
MMSPAGMAVRPPAYTSPGILWDVILYYVGIVELITVSAAVEILDQNTNM